MDSIRSLGPNTAPQAGATARVAAAPPNPETPVARTDSFVSSEALAPAARPEQPPATPTAMVAAEPPAATNGAPPKGYVNVPVVLTVPIELVTPDEHGNIPLQQYTPDLRPPDVFYTNKQEVDRLVDTVRKETLPTGTHAELDDSSAGHKIDVARNVIGKMAPSLGGLSVYSLAREGAHLTIPAAVAAPLALVAGGITVMSGLEAARKSLNTKAYYQELQKQGVQNLPVQVPQRTADGVRQTTIDVPIGRVIQGAQDQAVVGGVQALSGALTVAAGAAALAALPAAAALAIGAVVLNVAGPLYAMRNQFATLYHAVADKIKNRLHLGGNSTPAEIPELKQVPTASSLPPPVSPAGLLPSPEQTTTS